MRQPERQRAYGLTKLVRENPVYTATGLAIGIPFSISAFIAMYHYYLAPARSQSKK